MFFGAAKTCCKILDAVHVEASTSVTGRDDTFPSFHGLHSGDHFGFVGATIVSIPGVGLLLRHQRRRRTGDWYRRSLDVWLLHDLVSVRHRTF